ncbi:heme oxygenase [Rhizobium skierniewicense]|uniref:Heme oxygenase n=1 Tax=Rhizobium skierniewicense TaxID=984260 RepID=A0A7W6G3E9_9HYPH|nr:biliverdin-producing heme oxygenase [Rhizobium skierniewicense]MBB3948138.1 heme oxygenase [Rhizobium skierniewicense]
MAADIEPSIATPATETSRTKRLKAATSDAHDALDTFITAAKPFENLSNFAKFVQSQYLFHHDVDAFYQNERLHDLLPDLKGRRRLGLIEQDLADLETSVPMSSEARFHQEDATFDLAQAMGWLYVVEGSNLGAAFLLKDAAKLGLDETFGARHLAGAPEGRGLHWRTFVAALDAIALSEDEEYRVIAGAEAAFHAVHKHAVQMMA